MTELQVLEHCAAQGDAESQFKLGMKYVDAKRVTKDDAKGLALIQKAAEQGAAIASNTLADIYMGRDNISAGVRWLHIAAEQGLANAQGQLGILYSTNILGPQDDVKACAWLTVAMANGIEKAQKYYDKLRCRLSERKKVDVEKLIIELLTKFQESLFESTQNLLASCKSLHVAFPKYNPSA